MATTSTSTTTAAPSEEAAVRRPSQPLWQKIDRYLLPAFTILAIIYLLIPIAVMIVFSFNKPAGKFNYAWNEFSLDGWMDPFGWPGLSDAVITTLNGLIFLPMATPEIVMGASLLTLFVATALPPVAGSVPLLYPTGFHTIVIAHIMFCISFVVVAIKARLAGYDRRLEEAAMDLGADELTTFWKVTFPLILPGIIAAALLAFSLSIDDFVVTNFVSGTANTFPIWVYAIQRNALPVQINVVGSIVFLGAVGLVLISSLRSGGIPRLR